MLFVSEFWVHQFDVEIVDNFGSETGDNCFCEHVAQALSFTETERNERHFVSHLAIRSLCHLMTRIKPFRTKLLRFLPLIGIFMRPEDVFEDRGVLLKLKVAQFTVPLYLILIGEWCRRVESHTFIYDLVQENETCWCQLFIPEL